MYFHAFQSLNHYAGLPLRQLALDIHIMLYIYIIFNITMPNVRKDPIVMWTQMNAHTNHNIELP